MTAETTDGFTACVDVGRLLWRTRGLHWDYEFVMRPIDIDAAGWFWVHEAVFESLEGGVEPQYRIGRLVDASGGSVPFAGAALCDPVRQDSVGRPIIHYLLWFLEDGVDLRPESLPAGWPQQVLARFAAAFDSPAVFGSTDGSMGQNNPSAALSAILDSGDRSPIRVTGLPLSAAICSDVGEVKKKPRPASRGRKSQSRATTWWLWAAGFLMAILLSILYLLRS